MPELSDEQMPSVTAGDAADNLSFPTYCQARAVGEIADFSECLTKQPTGCTYGVPFGESRFCRHPQHKEIVARTR